MIRRNAPQKGRPANFAKVLLTAPAADYSGYRPGTSNNTNAAPRAAETFGRSRVTSSGEVYHGGVKGSTRLCFNRHDISVRSQGGKQSGAGSPGARLSISLPSVRYRIQRAGGTAPTIGRRWARILPTPPEPHATEDLLKRVRAFYAPYRHVRSVSDRIGQCNDSRGPLRSWPIQVTGGSG